MKSLIFFSPVFQPGRSEKLVGLWSSRTVLNRRCWTGISFCWSGENKPKNNGKGGKTCQCREKLPHLSQQPSFVTKVSSWFTCFSCIWIMVLPGHSPPPSEKNPILTSEPPVQTRTGFFLSCYWNHMVRPDLHYQSVTQNYRKSDQSLGCLSSAPLACIYCISDIN